MLTPEQQAEIAAARAAPRPTLRAVSEGMEAHLYLAHPVLDHGFVRVIDYMGDDAAIVQAARVSYGAGTRHVSNDEGLIRYLMRHWHSTPFEMCEVKLHVKLPVFVARQWIRHRTANVNEYSARYSILDREFYIPAPEHLAAQSTVNNQGRGAVLEGEEAARVLDTLKRDAAQAYDSYEAMLSQEGQAGLARELARMNLPMNIYTQWYWKTDLHNLFHFLRLRADAHAQYEIRVYAEAIAACVRDWVPLAWAAFEDYRMGGVNLSAKAVAVLKRRLAGEAVTQEASGMSKGEWREFVEVWGGGGHGAARPHFDPHDGSTDGAHECAPYGHIGWCRVRIHAHHDIGAASGRKVHRRRAVRMNAHPTGERRGARMKTANPLDAPPAHASPGWSSNTAGRPRMPPRPECDVPRTGVATTRARGGGCGWAAVPRPGRTG